VKQRTLIGTSLLSAIAASLCCITPVLALIAGTSGIASTFSWIEPVRPYLIAVSIVVLGFAWYQRLKPVAKDECGCAVDEKPRFMQSKQFLLIITLFAGVMITFPYYSKVFFQNDEKTVQVNDQVNIQTAEFDIKGMTCSSCEEHVKHEVNKLQGIVKAEVSYEKNNAVVSFDKTKTSLTDIGNAINSTGYSVIKTIQHKQ
jgi:mercuric ion transport protein